MKIQKDLPHIKITKLLVKEKTCLMRYFHDAGIRTHVNIEFAKFSNGREDFF